MVMERYHRPRSRAASKQLGRIYCLRTPPWSSKRTILMGMEDFVKMVEVEDEEKKRNLREAFEMYEMEGSGCTTAKSLKRMLGRLGETRTTEQCRAMITPFVLNGDGMLSFNEFRIMMV